VVDRVLAATVPTNLILQVALLNRQLTCCCYYCMHSAVASVAVPLGVVTRVREVTPVEMRPCSVQHKLRVKVEHERSWLKARPNIICLSQ
jgi:hypothetical protein